MAITITSTATAPQYVYLDDLGIEPLQTPFTNYDLTAAAGITLDEASRSEDLRLAVDSGYIVVHVDGAKVTDVGKLSNAPVLIVLDAPAVLKTSSKKRYEKVAELAWTPQDDGKYRVSCIGKLTCTKKWRFARCRMEYDTGTARAVIAGASIQPTNYGDDDEIDYADIQSVCGFVLLDLVGGNTVKFPIMLRADSGSAVLKDAKVVIEKVVF